MRNAAELTWSVHKTPEGPLVAVCDALNATVEAHTMEELEKSAQEATDLVISARLEEVLSGLGTAAGARRRRERKGTGKVVSSHVPTIQVGQLQAA